jgi:type 1 fimbria pilin
VSISVVLNFARQPFVQLDQMGSGRQLYPAMLTSLVLAFLTSPPVHADSADVQFRGSVAAPTCTVSGTGNASGTGEGIALNMGVVLVNQLLPAGQWASHGKTINLRVDCPGRMGGYLTARATFDSLGGSGVDPNDGRLLRLSGDSTAQDVAVGVWRPGSAAPLDLRTRPSLTGRLLPSGGDTRAEIAVSILMSRTSAAPSSGTAHAQLPFLLSYE